MSIAKQEPLQNLGVMVAQIRATSDTGRLALRNTVRMGMLHLYFERGQLVHFEGSHGSTDDALIDLAGWSGGMIRFDAGVLAERQTVTPAQQEFFQRTLLLMQQRGVLAAQPQRTPREPMQPSSNGLPRPGLRPAPEITSTRLPIPPASPQPLSERFAPTIDDFLPPQHIQWPTGKNSSVPQRERPASMPLFPSSVPGVSNPAEAVLSARQWELLVEVMHSMIESVGQLFGQQQAQNILQHVLLQRSEESEVLGLLQIDRQGWLREIRVHEMMAQSVEGVAGAFVLLISDFERRCAALLGEEKARQMIARALYPYHDGLAEIGIVLN